MLIRRSGGEWGWGQGRPHAAFRRLFAARQYRVVTGNDRACDEATLLARSLMQGPDAPTWFRRGDRYAGYRHRFATDRHTDIMDAMS